MMTRSVCIAASLLLLGAAPLPCKSVFIYRLDEGDTHRGGWVTTAGDIIVHVSPDLVFRGSFGIRVCADGLTDIEFFKP